VAIAHRVVWRGGVGPGLEPGRRARPSARATPAPGLYTDPHFPTLPHHHHPPRPSSPVLAVRFLPLLAASSGNRTISSPSCSPVAVPFLRAQCGAVLTQTRLVLRALLRRSDLALPRGSGRISGQCGERFFVVV
jgi:hypothetical protein